MDNNITFTAEEQRQLAKLAADAERNKADAQRLALDAGKLLTVTSERLDDYKDRGFFKRCWYKISGKQGSLDRANQADLISMQRFAWAYLVKLQEQNILEAQAIAVIRNNLKDLQSETADIHDMISAIVTKFDARIKKLEESTAMLDWKNHVSATASEFAVNKKFFCFLQLVFECLNAMRTNSVKLGSVRVEEYFYTAMKDLGLNPDAEWTVNDFISGLYEDVGAIGFNKFHQAIELSVDGKRIESDYILNNVTGAGYNAIYQFDVEMANMQNISAQLRPEDAKPAMLETVRKSINNGSTKYSAKELALEIIGGSLIAEEVYCEENGVRMAGVEEQPTLAPAFSIDDLLEKYVSISCHAFLETMPTEDEKRIYLESFALVFATNGGCRESHYLTAIAKLFGVEDSLARIELLSINPKKLSIPDLITVLSTDERKYAWCVDAMFVGEEDGVANPRVKSAVMSMCKVFGFKENEIGTFLEKVESLATGNDPKSLYEAICGINRQTQAWRSVVDFKRISLKGAFDDLCKRMSSKSFEGTKLSIEISQVSMKMAMSSCMLAFGDENFLQRSAINVERASYISKFKELKSRVETYKSSAMSVLSEGNSVLSLFGTKTIGTKGGLYSIEADEASGIGNENWGDNMNSAYDKLSDYLTGISDAFDKIIAQIRLYEDGRYSESAEENAKKKRELEAAKKEADKESKKSAKIEKGGVSATVRFNFVKVEDLPFDFSKAKCCTRFVDRWLLIVDKACWSSGDGDRWSEVKVPVEIEYGTKVKVVNNVAIMWSDSRKQFAYSKDGLSWTTSEFPEEYANRDILFFRGRWMLQHMGYKDYKYMKEGLIWDSEETGSCDYTDWYSADDLSGAWNKELSMQFSTGYYIPEGSAFVSGDELIAIKAISSSYASDKHIAKTNPELHYYDGSEWKRASVKGGLDDALFPKGKFLQLKNGVLFSINDNGTMFSTDNHNWEKVCDKGPCWGFHSIGNLACALGYGEHGATAYVTVDGIDFVPVVLDCTPSVAAFFGDTAIVVYDDANKGGLYRVKVEVS